MMQLQHLKRALLENNPYERIMPYTLVCADQRWVED
jgi:hypothetical protein